MNILELNRVAVWRPKLLDELTVRETGAGRPCMKNKVIAKTEAITYRYAKNYKVGKTKFCLFVVSYSDSKVSVEQFLDKCAKELDEAIVQKVVATATNSDFEWTDFYYEGK